jgi:glutathione S-transferase
MLELYHSGLTTCSKQVRHCLREKGLAYQSRYVELWRYENLSPDYLKLNPNGVVPTLVHDGVPIINSFCINEYIDDAFPRPALRPADARERARMRYWAWTADEVHHAIARLSHAHMMQAKIRDLSAADQKFMLAHTPVPDKRERWRVLIERGYSAEQLHEALENVLFVFGQMERELGQRGPWLAGPTFSLGDISMAAIVHRTSELYPDKLGQGAFPHLNEWWERLLVRPAAKYVYSDGLEETPSRPSKQSIAGITEFRI